MTTLMVYAGAEAGDAEVTRTGGVPLVPAEFSWPACRTCAGHMRFLAQVMLADLRLDEWRGVLSIFLCENDPGMCDDWDPAAGGNQALLFPLAGLRPAAVPAGQAAMPGEASAVRCVPVNAAYDEARETWSGREGRPRQMCWASSAASRSGCRVTKHPSVSGALTR